VSLNDIGFRVPIRDAYKSRLRPPFSYSPDDREGIAASTISEDSATGDRNPPLLASVFVDALTIADPHHHEVHVPHAAF
jgi:hypothetical protein